MIATYFLVQARKKLSHYLNLKRELIN